MGPDVVPQMLDILTQQVAAPVQFIKGLRTLYDAGARVFIEVGPKKALHGFAEDVLGSHSDVVSLFTNHPKIGDLAAFNQALCGLYAAGLGRGTAEALREPLVTAVTAVSSPKETSKPTTVAATGASTASAGPSNGNRYDELGRFFADVLDRGYEIYHGQPSVSNGVPVVITGAALGLPGTERIFDDGNIARILRGDQFIDSIPTRFRQAMLDKHITRLVKSETGEPRFETIGSVADVIKLAGRGGAFNLEDEFGISAERVGALDRVTQLAMAAGIDALRDAGIPLVMRYKTTSKGTQLPERWGLPESLRDDTGVIFCSAFPGYDAFADEMARYYADHERREQLVRHRQRTLRLQSALPAPRPVHGTFAIRRIYRCPRSQHANQLCLCDHHPGSIAGGGLDSRRPVQPRDRDLSRRRDLRPSDRLDGRGFPRQRSGSHRRGGRGRGHSLRPPSTRLDHRHGRCSSGGGERRRRP